MRFDFPDVRHAEDEIPARDEVEQRADPDPRERSHLRTDSGTAPAPTE